MDENKIIIHDEIILPKFQGNLKKFKNEVLWYSRNLRVVYLRLHNHGCRCSRLQPPRHGGHVLGSEREAVPVRDLHGHSPLPAPEAHGVGQVAGAQQRPDEQLHSPADQGKKARRWHPRGRDGTRRHHRQRLPLSDQRPAHGQLGREQSQLSSIYMTIRVI